MKRFVLNLSAALCAAGAAQAADMGDWKNAGGNPTVVYTEPTGSPGLYMFCPTKGDIEAIVVLDGGDAVEKLNRQSQRIRKRDGALNVGDKSSIETWTYYPSLKLAAAEAGSHDRRIFNAIVTGSEIQLNLERMDPITMTPPPPNDAFKAFAKICL